MKNTNIIVMFAASLFISLAIPACNEKNKMSISTDSTLAAPQMLDTGMIKTTPPPQTAPVDESLSTVLSNVIKDYPGVTAVVNGDEVTLSGNITQQKLTELMTAVNGMHPGKINNNLIVK